MNQDSTVNSPTTFTYVLRCFLDKERVCANDCMAYREDLDENCLLLSAAKKLANPPRKLPTSAVPDPPEVSIL